MKTRLSTLKGIKLLKRNEKLCSNSIYVIGAESVARNLFFRSKADLEVMHLKIRQHLKMVADVLDYVFTPYGFILLIRTKPDGIIINNYNNVQKRKGKFIRYSTSSQIVSEQIRLAISTAARKINSNNNRSGAITHSNFFRMVGDSMVNVNNLLKFALNKITVMCRQNRKYRAKLFNWNRDGLISKNDLLITPIKENESINQYTLIEIKYYSKNDFLNFILKNTFKKHISISP